MTSPVRASVAESRSGPLRVETLELDDPRAGEVVIEMKAAGLCHSDLARFDGTRTDWPDYPLVLGHEGAGIVAECGPGVTSVKPGDRVIPVPIPECGECAACRSGKTNICERYYVSDIRRPFRRAGAWIRAFCELGTFSQRILAREIQVARLPDDAPLDALACMGCAGMTGLGAVLYTARVEAGASVAVYGAGGIGLTVIAGARVAGASPIVAIDANPAKEAPARRAGATHFILSGGAEGEVAARVRELTGGGADYAFECAGVPALLRQAVEATRRGWGTTVMLGVPASGQDIALRPHAILEGRRVIGAYLGNVKTRSQLPRLVELCMSGQVDLGATISHRFALDEIGRGFELLAAGRLLRGVVVF